MMHLRSAIASYDEVKLVIINSSTVFPANVLTSSVLRNLSFA